MPIARARTRNRTGQRTFVVAADTENSPECNSYTTRYVKRDKSLTPGFSMHRDNDMAYRVKDVDDAVKFFVGVREKYPNYSVWLFTDNYSFSPMRQAGRRRNGAFAGWIAGQGWARGSDPEYARLIDAAGENVQKQAAADIEAQRAQSRAANAAFAQKQAAAAKQKADSKKWFNDWLRGVNESGKEPTKAELLDQLIKMCKPGSGVRNALEEIKDKFALDESNTYVQDDNDLEAADDGLWDAIDRLVERKDLTADECEWDAHANVLILTYKGIGWYEGHAASAFGPAEPGGFAEEVEDDVESDLTKVHDEFLKSSGFDFEFTRDSVKTAIADAAELVRKDGEEAISQKENRFGDWDYTADCVVRIPCRLTYGSADVLPEDDEIEEKEELLPDCVVNEAVETLRRMY